MYHRRYVPLIALICLGTTGTVNAAPKSKKSTAQKAKPALQGSWQTTSDGCKVWNPEPKPEQAVTWGGQCVNGFGSGYGTQVWTQYGALDITIVGSMQNGFLTGQVMLLYPDKSRFHGSLKNGRWHGPGIFVSAEGQELKAVWNEGVRVERGLMPIDRAVQRVTELNSSPPKTPTPAPQLTKNEQSCLNYGFKRATAAFSQCVLQIDQAQRQAELEEQRYQFELQQYQQQVAAYQAQQEAIKKEKDRRKWSALAAFGFGMASTNSPTFGGGVADGLRALNGQPPLPPPTLPSRPSGIDNYTIRMPNGLQVRCSYNSMASYMDCR